MELNNDITINPDEIRLLPNNSITDAETIRQIALYAIKFHDNSLNCKIQKGLEFAGLYPHIMGMPYDILSDGMNKELYMMIGTPGKGRSYSMQYLIDKYKEPIVFPEIVSFDFDKTLTDPKIQRMVKVHQKAGDTIHIVTSRISEMYDLDRNYIGKIDNEDVYDLAKELGIKEENIHFTEQQLKLDTLIKIGSTMHYDDDVIEIDNITRNNKDITGILIKYKI